MGTFKQKLLRVIFTLSNGATFTGSGDANQLELTGLRTTAWISCKGMPAFPQAEIAIWGMKQSDMNALSALAFKTTGLTRNTVQVDANSGDGWTTVYAGNILAAVVDYRAAPAVCLRVTAQMMYFDLVNPANVTSFTGPTPAATVISAIVAKMNYAFQNHGVEGHILNSPYFPGTLADQLRDAVAHAGVDMYMEAGARVQTVAICPKGFPRDTPTFDLSPASGLMNYPVIDSRGFVHAQSIYNPAFRFGGKLTISGSDVVIDPNRAAFLPSRANGTWLIGTMEHTLEAVKPDGVWMTEMLLYPPGTEPPQQ